MSLTDGLVGAWVPALGPTAGVLVDRSAYSNHGTLTNMDPATDWQASDGGWCLDFDGTNDYVLLPARSAELPFSLSVWFRSANLGKTYQALFTANATTSAASIYCGVHYISGSSRMIFYGSGSYATNSDAFSNDFGLHHYAWSVQLGGAGQYFRDGVQIGAFSRNVTATSPTAGSVGSGGVSASAGFTTQGQISECTRWSKALTPTEIKTLYQAGPGGWLARKRRRVYSIPGPAFKAAWAARATTIAGVLR